MKEHKRIPFQFENQDYEVRVLYDDKTVSAVPFYRNRPQNCFRYRIQVPKEVDAVQLLETEAIGSLIKMAKDDIIEKRGHALTQILQKVVSDK